MNKLLECIPNASEGCNPKKIEEMAHAINKVNGVKLLHTDSGQAANRTVFTFAGKPEAVIEAAFELYRKAGELIDMSQHSGTHPRQGAVDVCPLVPLKGVTMEEVVDLTYRLGERIGGELGIPGYYYEYSAKDPQRKNLAALRKGEYESLPEKFNVFPPDFGKTDEVIWKKSGVTVLGARKLLIAYNVNLNTREIAIARKIAARVRESGKLITQADGSKIRIRGKLQAVKGLGWYIEDFQKAQVSYNLTDVAQAGMLDVFLATQTEAERLGFEVTGSELIGLAPLSEFLKVGQYFYPAEIKEPVLIKAAVKGLGLAELGVFDPHQKIIEYTLE